MGNESYPLICAGRVWGAAELLAGDSDVFGFPVGRFVSGETPPSKRELAEARETLLDWSKKTGAAILWAAVAGRDLAWCESLAALDFACIDLTLQMTLSSLKRRPRPAFDARVRTVCTDDHAVLESIASTAFNFGRYHRDRRFPRELANKRFEVWLRKSLQRPEPGMRFFAIGPAGRPTAFMFSEVKQEKAQLWLAAVAPDASNGLVGPMLYAGTLDALEAEGVRSVTTKISAVNTAVMNIYTHLGFQASAPEFTYHWRSPGSPWLLSPES